MSKVSSSADDPESLITCPYDPAHRIRRYRMQGHLVKCRRNYQDVKMVECIYNVSHRVPEPELEFHLDFCEGRINLDKFVYVDENVERNKYPIPDIDTKCSENWDDNCPTYDASEYCQANAIVRQVSTLSSAKRKDFRHQERKRIQDIHNNPIAPLPTKSVEKEVRRPIHRKSGAQTTKNIEESDPYMVAQLLEKLTIDKKVSAENIDERESKVDISEKSDCKEEKLNIKVEPLEFPALTAPPLFKGRVNKSNAPGKGRGRGAPC